MNRYLLIFLFLASTLTASDGNRLYELYQNGQYLQACNEGVKKLGQHQQDEKYISLYAFSCLQADKIDRLALPIIMLKNSNEARKNAAYFASILLQKNLLISALENQQPLDALNLPTTDYVLSRVFDLFSTGRYTLGNGVYSLSDPKLPRQTYRMYLNRSDNSVALIIDEYYDTILTKQHLYR